MLRTRKSRSISLCLLHCVPLHLLAEGKSMTEKFLNILHISRCFEVVRQHCWMGTLSIRNIFCFPLFICTIHPGWRPCNVTEAFQITRVFTLNWDFYAFLNHQLALLCLSKTSHLTSLCPEGARNPPEAVWNLSNLTYLFFFPPGIDIVPIPYFSSHSSESESGLLYKISLQCSFSFVMEHDKWKSKYRKVE